MTDDEMTFREFIRSIANEFKDLGHLVVNMFRSLAIHWRVYWRAMLIWNIKPDGHGRQARDEYLAKLKQDPLFKGDLDKADKLFPGDKK